MKVRELIEFLEECDEDAEVLFISQPNWPFEYSIRDCLTRDEIQDPEGHRDEKCQSNDVILVEGAQLRYGSKACWVGGW